MTTHPGSRGWKIFAVLCLAGASTTGCLSRKLAYNWADSFIERNIDAAFDLSGEQERFVERRVGAHLDWHRASQLPAVARILGEAQERMEDGISDEDTQWTFAQLGALRNEIARRVAPDAGTFLASVTDAQLRNLAKDNAKRNRKRFEPLNGPADKYVEDRVARLERNISYFTGYVTPEQRRKLVEFVRESRAFDLGQKEHAMRTQQEFIAFLGKKPPAEAIARQVQAWVTQPEARHSASFAPLAREQRAQWGELIQYFDRTGTPEQKEAVKRVLNGIRKDCLELSSGA